MKTKQRKFKIGDKVFINTEPRSRFTDCLADIQSSLVDRDITSASANRLESALFDNELCVVVDIEDTPDNQGGYIVKPVKDHNRHTFPWQFEEEDLIPGE